MYHAPRPADSLPRSPRQTQFILGAGGYFEHDLYRINEESAVTSDDNEKEALSLEMDDLLALHNEARWVTASIIVISRGGCSVSCSKRWSLGSNYILDAKRGGKGALPNNFFST